MDTFLAIASRRETRRYSDRPIPEDVRRQILDAGRLAGSAKNRQPWRFLVVESPERRSALAEAVYEPGNVRGAQFVVAIQAKGSLDTGRCVQNMLLAAWNAGVGSCPNGLADEAKAHDALGIDPEEPIAIVLTFGYPQSERDPERHTPDDWGALADRKPLDELVERL